jgi:protein MPE1
VKLTLLSQTPVFRPAGNKKGGPPANIPDHEPPTGYICYRCGEKGHWIQVCPTNDDPTFDNKPRVKRTTGIPRSFLKTVEKPMALSNDGTTDDTKAPSGIMVNAEGEFVIAEPDKASWEQFQAKTKSSAAAQKAAASGDKELQDRGLECSIDKRMFIDPMKTPCCEKTYCNDCITNALIESDFTCPGCGTDEVLIDNLKPDEEMSGKIKAYLDEKDAVKKEKEKPGSPNAIAEEPKATEVGTAEIVSVPMKEKILSPSPVLTSTAAAKSSKSPSPETKLETEAVDGPPTVPKKRPANELLENPKIPKGPKAMQQQETEKQAQLQQQAMMNSMNPMAGFPSMPMGFDMSQQFNNNGFNMGVGGFNMMNGYGMGMPGSMSMPQMMGMSTSMMNPMMGMNGFPMSSGFTNLNAMGIGGPGMYNNGMGYGGNMGAMGTGSNSGLPNSNGGNAGVFPNQQKTVFAAPLPNEEDNAYFRKPVNPHRHQGRQRRARPSDYREL